MIESANITLPAGASNHGNQNLLCLPAKWTDIAVFFIGNYIAHAGTVRFNPGCSFLEACLTVIESLLYPVAGVARGLGGIYSLAKFGATDLQIAARAGAVCTVIRTEGRARSTRESRLNSDESWLSGKVHGTIVLPPGFGLIFVPRRATFKDDSRQLKTLSSNYNALSILIAIGQLAFAITTLYRSRGDQIARYGYAAFGLTVTQYAMMSLVNLLGNLICPQYPVIYLVESIEMKEARKLPNAVFEGVVGELDELCDQEIREYRDQVFLSLRENTNIMKRVILDYILGGIGGTAWVPTAISIVIIAALTHFDRASSTLAQRVWIMSWFCCGNYAQFLAAYDMLRARRRWSAGKLNRNFVYQFLFIILSSVPSIGGFVVVGEMLSEYGVCTLIS